MPRPLEIESLGGKVMGTALASGPLYPLYARRAPDPLADQQIAGLVMWVPAGLILTVVGVALFAAWMGDASRRPDAFSGRRDSEVASASVE